MLASVASKPLGRPEAVTAVPIAGLGEAAPIWAPGLTCHKSLSRVAISTARQAANRFMALSQCAEIGLDPWGIPRDDLADYFDLARMRH